MTNIDQFESVFKAADKPQFHLLEQSLNHVLYVTDGDDEQTQQFAEMAAVYVDVIKDLNETTATKLSAGSYETVESLLDQIAQIGPDYIVTYRNLHVPADDYLYGVGVYVDVLTQATKLPIMVLPNPRTGWKPKSPALQTVMAMTDHMTHAERLISIAARCVRPNGHLWLTHVEDQVTLERYLAVIGKIPEIDTDIAREKIVNQILREPREYIETCRKAIRAAGLELEVHDEVVLGDHLSDYRRLVEQHEVELLVMNTKDDEQLAMHGLAHPLAVEMRETPLLLL